MKLSNLSFVFTLVMVLTMTVGNSQNIRKLEKKADASFERLDYINALNYYKEITEIDSTKTFNAYRAGLCLFNLGKRDEMALKYFQAAAKDHSDAHFYIGRIYHLQDDLGAALREFVYCEENYHLEAEVSIEEIQRWIVICKNSIAYKANANDIVVTKLGSEINSIDPDYAPFLSSDEQTLVFTSRRPGSTGNVRDPYGNYFEDIYYSQKVDSTWMRAKAFDYRINTATHDAGVTFANDTTLIIYRTDAKQTGGDLYESFYQNGAWQKPKLMTDRINSEYQEPSATFSEDGDVIFFSSTKPGGEGGRDLYRIIRFSGNMYSLPFNLGPTINTPYDEDAPFLSKDKKTLYYSSKGKGSMGGYDIFSVELDENYVPKNPQNMGMPINSTADDIYFVLNKSGETGYFSSNRDDNTNIFSVEIRNRNYVVVKGKVSVSDNKEIDLSDIQISVVERDTRKLNGVYRLKTNYNSFILLVNKTKAYDVRVESPEIETFQESMKFSGQDVQLNLVPKQ